MELCCSCLCGTSAKRGFKPCSPFGKVMPVILLQHLYFGCLLLSFFCMYSLFFLASHYCFSGYVTKQNPKLLLSKYLCKISSRHNLLLLTVGLHYLYFFDIKHQNMAEREPVLREKSFPDLENDLKGRVFNSTMALGTCCCLSYSLYFPMDYYYFWLNRNVARQSS